MKDYKKLIWVLPLATAVVGCTDFVDNTTNYNVDKPESTAQYEYLNSYGTLKSYVDRSAHPGFLLGTGVNAQEYLQKTGVYLLTNSNFDQVTTGNAMKYASVVGDDGTMNFGTVMDFVDAATGAGLEVYGHTLCWHEQQNVKWLNSLIADKTIEVDPNERLEIEDAVADFSAGASWGWGQWGNSAGPTINADGCFELSQDTPMDYFWELQYQIVPSVNLVKGNKYILKVMVKGTGEGKICGKVGDWGGGAEFGNGISFGTDWEEKTFDFTAAVDGNNFVLFQHGDFVGTVEIKYVKIVHEEAPKMEIEVEEERRAIEVCSADKVQDAWETQFWIMTDATFNAGDKWEVSMNIRADKEAGSSTQIHKGAGEYLHWQGIGNPTFTRSWENFSASGTFPAEAAGGHSIAFNLNEFAAANTYYFDDISFKINGVEMVKNSSCDDDNVKDNYISKEKNGELTPSRFVDRVKNVIQSNKQPLTSEEKAEILTAEMERWVKAMMEATEGKVKAWDVVNEPLSGGPWGQRYDLQHAATATGDQSNKFYWQDYLGDNYVRVPIKFARQYFQGNPEELKLFINDYNLESTWDDNQKLKSLLQWIEQWESDGETKIDGIGSQMHVSYNMNPEAQARQEEHIVKMYQLLAQSGKLVRVTELDMGIVDAEGNSIKTADLTFEQKQAMADFYKFIVEKYFEIIPVDQQYGICAWAQTDSPEGSGWRAGEPIGLWDLNLSRKPAYGGFADGLAGK